MSIIIKLLLKDALKNVHKSLLPNPGNEAPELWQEMFDLSQLILTIIGFFANIATVVTMTVNGKAFSPILLALLKHQSIIDATACLMVGVLLVQTPMWLPGYYVLDLLMCHVWNGQVLYWYFALISTWNLVCLAYERYLAVCKPFAHIELTHKKLYIVIALVYIHNFIIIFGGFLQTRIVDGVCRSQYFIDGEEVVKFFFVYSFVWFTNIYVVPCAFFVVFYGLVILAFNKRKKSSQLGSSKTIDKATSELTKTAFIVTVIFIMTLGYDSWYYLLGNTGTVLFELNSVPQKVAVWLASFNSVVNPFIYGMLMPAYRKSLQDTFCRWTLKPNTETVGIVP